MAEKEDDGKTDTKEDTEAMDKLKKYLLKRSSDKRQ